MADMEEAPPPPQQTADMEEAPVEQQQQQQQQTYWCHECDISLHLLFSRIISANDENLVCPNCQHGSLEPLEHTTSTSPSSRAALLEAFLQLDSPSFRHLIHYYSDDEQQGSKTMEETLGKVASIRITSAMLEKEPHCSVCAVCNEDFDVGVNAKRLPCSHVFHQHCIVSWLCVSSHPSCPLCRLVLPTHD